MKTTLFLLFHCIIIAYSDVYTFPVKSLNLEVSPTPDWYNVETLAGVTTDAHAVMGIQVSDGYVLCGKGLESEGSTNSEAFVTKLNSNGVKVWGFTNGNNGASDACNAVTELADGSILAAGYEISGGVAKRTIHKLNGNTGAKIWTANDFGDSAANNGAYEMIEYSTGCGDGVLLTGFTGKADTTEMSFKSYGNTGGQAIIQHIPAATVNSGTAPTSANVAWTKVYAGYLTAKTAHCVTGASNTNKVPVLLWGENALGASFAVLDNTGTEVVAPQNFNSDHGEGTDMQVDSTGQYAYMTGQGARQSDNVGYQARLSKIAIADGTKSWTHSYLGGGGTPQLIYNECWGVVVESDGVVLSCGTGIEECGTKVAPYATPCNQGLGDTRTGALARAAGVWQVLTIKTDLDGTLVWQQVMSHKASGGPALGSSSWEAGSSAGEWAIKTSDGGLAIVTDQADGVGVLKLGTTAWGSNAPTSTTSSSSASPASMCTVMQVLMLVSLSLTFISTFI